MVGDDEFRRVIGRFATGVTVMCAESDGEPHGMTANAVSSVSLDPLLVLVCVERSTTMANFVESSGRFTLSILTADQRPLSDHFANPDREAGAAQFRDVPTEQAPSGLPVIAGHTGWLDCRVWATYDGGDHVIVVGEVEALDPGVDADALLYYRSSYGIAPLESPDQSVPQ